MIIGERDEINLKDSKSLCFRAHADSQRKPPFRNRRKGQGVPQSSRLDRDEKRRRKALAKTSPQNNNNNNEKKNTTDVSSTKIHSGKTSRDCPYGIRCRYLANGTCRNTHSPLTDKKENIGRAPENKTSKSDNVGKALEDKFRYLENATFGITHRHRYPKSNLHNSLQILRQIEEVRVENRKLKVENGKLKIENSKKKSQTRLDSDDYYDEDFYDW